MTTLEIEVARPVDGLRTVAESLWQRPGELDQLQVALARTFSAYESVPDGDLLRSARRNTIRALSALSPEAVLAAPEETEQASSARRLLQGVAVEDVQVCYRLVMGALRDAFLDEALVLGIPAEVSLAGVRALWTVTDRYTADLIEGRDPSDCDPTTTVDARRRAFVHRLVSGSLRREEIATAGAPYGVRPDQRFWVFRTTAAHDSLAEVVSQLERCAVGTACGPLVGVVGGDPVGLALRRPAPFDSRVPIAVAGPRPVHEISDAFAEATSLLYVARRFGRGGIVDRDSLGILTAIANEPQVGESLFLRYVVGVQAAAGAMASVLLETVGAFLDHNRAYQKTADTLNVHVNTLRHRLNRYEELVNDAFARPEMAFDVWWALRYAQIRRGED